MAEDLEELELQFQFQEYNLHDKIEGFIYNFQYYYNEDHSVYAKIYFISKDSKNYFIKIPFYFSLLIETSKTSDLEEFIKGKYSEGYHSSLLVERFDTKEYNYLNKEKKKYLKVNFKNRLEFIRVVKDMKKVKLNNKNTKKIENVYKEMIINNETKDREDISDFIIDIHEYDIPLDIAIANEYNFTVGKWHSFSYDGEMYSITALGVTELPNLRTFSFNIQTSQYRINNENLSVIVMISIKTDTSNILILNYEIFTKRLENFDYCSEENTNSTITTYNMNSEEEVLLKFVELFQIYKPHVITTFSENESDLYCLESRLLKYNIYMKEVMGFYREKSLYICPCVVHVDLFKYFFKDFCCYSEFPRSKILSKLHSEILTNELDLDIYEEKYKDLFQFASNVVSYANAIFELFNEHVKYNLFFLCKLISIPPVKIYHKNVTNLIDAILINHARKNLLLIPKENRDKRFEVFNDKVVDNVAQSNDLNEIFNFGIYSSHFEFTFKINKQKIDSILNVLDEILEQFKEEDDILEIKNIIKNNLLHIKDNNKYKVKIVNADFHELCSDIILANKIQPFSIVNEDFCLRCDFFEETLNCRKSINWEQKIDYFFPHLEEIKQIEERTIKEFNNSTSTRIENFEIDKSRSDIVKINYDFSLLSKAKQENLIRKSIYDHSRNVYKNTKNSLDEKLQTSICQKAVPLFTEFLQELKDKKEKYKNETINSTSTYDAVFDLKEDNEVEKKESKYLEREKKESKYLEILNVQKFIIKSVRDYLKEKNNRWSSFEMSGIINNLESKIIKFIVEIMDGFSIFLKIDSKEMFFVIPTIFPYDFLFKSGKKFNFLELYINYVISKKNVVTTLSINLKTNYNGIYIPIISKKLKQDKIPPLIKWSAFEVIYGEVNYKSLFDLKIIKKIHYDLLEEVKISSSLEDSYKKVGSICEYWLDLIANQGKSLDDEIILELFSELKVIKNNTKDGGNNLLKKIKDLMGEDYEFEKINIRCLILKYPKNEKIENRTIPVFVFKSKKHEELLKKWCNISENLNIHELLDWEFYKKKLEDFCYEWVSLPAQHQRVKNPLPFLEKSDFPPAKVTSKSDLFDYCIVKKRLTNEVKVKNILNCQVVDNKFLDFYKKLKERNGILKIVEEEKSFVLHFYNKSQITIPIEKKIFFKADKIFFIENKVKFEERYLPGKNSLEKIAFITLQKDHFYKILNSPRVKEIYNENVPLIFYCKFQDYGVSKFPDFVILTTFQFGKFTIYVFSRNDKFVFISNFKHSKIENINLQDFLKKNINYLVILNEADKALENLKKICSKFVICYERKLIKKTLCSFDRLLENQKLLHKELANSFDLKASISSYIEFPICNIKINYLDYLYFKYIENFNGLISKGGEESFRLFKNERICPGYYKYFSIQFECVGSLILSIKEYKSLGINLQDFERADFKALYELITQLLKDYSRNIKGSNILINNLEYWIRKESSFLSKELRDIINLLHQRYIFNLISFFDDIKIKLIYISGNIFCIETEKDTKEGAEKLFAYIKKSISKREEYKNLALRQLQCFDKLICINPNNYFYKKTDKFFCISDYKIPIEFIKKFFNDEIFTGDFIYNLITKIDKEEALIIVSLLHFIPDMFNIISNCYKLLQIDEYSEKDFSIEMLIICEKCKLENVLRTRCIKCMNKYSRREIYEIIEKYFQHFLYLELGDETYCNKCNIINERKLQDYCGCGGIFKKKSYIRELQYIINKLKNEDIVKQYKKKLEFYNIKF